MHGRDNVGVGFACEKGYLGRLVQEPSVIDKPADERELYPHPGAAAAVEFVQDGHAAWHVLVSTLTCCSHRKDVLYMVSAPIVSVFASCCA